MERVVLLARSPGELEALIDAVACKLAVLQFAALSADSSLRALTSASSFRSRVVAKLGRAKAEAMYALKGKRRLRPAERKALADVETLLDAVADESDLLPLGCAPAVDRDCMARAECLALRCARIVLPGLTSYDDEGLLADSVSAASAAAGSAGFGASAASSLTLFVSPSDSPLPPSCASSVPAASASPCLVVGAFASPVSLVDVGSVLSDVAALRARDEQLRQAEQERTEQQAAMQAAEAARAAQLAQLIAAQEAARAAQQVAAAEHAAELERMRSAEAVRTAELERLRAEQAAAHAAQQQLHEAHQAALSAQQAEATAHAAELVRLRAEQQAAKAAAKAQAARVAQLEEAIRPRNAGAGLVFASALSQPPVGGGSRAALSSEQLLLRQLQRQCEEHAALLARLYLHALESGLHEPAAAAAAAAGLDELALAKAALFAKNPIASVSASASASADPPAGEWPVPGGASTAAPRHTAQATAARLRHFLMQNDEPDLATPEPARDSAL
jgi:hypothetical protein